MSRFSDYLYSIGKVNNLAEPGCVSDILWFFHCGMLFSSRYKWWKDFGKRTTSHEGIDIAWFAADNEIIRHFDETILVPAMDSGTIVNICDDFLGRTIVVEPYMKKTTAQRLVFAYAHVIPAKDLKTGSSLRKGQVIAKISRTHRNARPGPHLHFSCIEISRNIPCDLLDWNLFTTTGKANLINPVFL